MTASQKAPDSGWGRRVGSDLFVVSRVTWRHPPTAHAGTCRRRSSRSWPAGAASGRTHPFGNGSGNIGKGLPMAIASYFRRASHSCSDL